MSPSPNASRVLSPEAMFKRAALVLFLILLVASVSTAQITPRGCNQVEKEEYLADIRSKLYENWRVPYRHKTVSCIVLIKQDFRGEVVDVGIAKCSDDPQIHKSVVDAAYRTSPLPRPKNKACFDRNIILKIESRSQSYN